MTEHTLTDFLPNAMRDKLTSFPYFTCFLKTLELIANSINDTITSFSKGNYDDFDAQVSDNLCQIRAYKTVSLARKHQQFSTKLLRGAAQIKAVCNHYYKNQNGFEIHEFTTIDYFLNSHGIKIILDDDDFYLIQTFILSKYKNFGNYRIPQGIDYSKIINDTGISSKTLIKKLIHHFQRNVSAISCKYIFNLLEELAPDIYQLKLIRELYFKDEVNRHVVSGYEAMNVILTHAKKMLKNIKILLFQISENEFKSITFNLNISEEGQYVKNLNEADINRTLFTFAGIVQYTNNINESADQYIDRFLTIGLKEIILANLAQHPQYPGLHLQNKKYNPYQSLYSDSLPPLYRDFIRESEQKFLYYKSLATEIGCTPNNSSLFLLTHVYCDTCTMPNIVATEMTEAA